MFPLQIIAEGIRGTSYTGDIAIDDFKFISGVSCQITPASANPNAQTTKPSTTLPVTTTPVVRKFHSLAVVMITHQGTLDLHTSFQFQFAGIVLSHHILNSLLEATG